MIGVQSEGAFNHKGSCRETARERVLSALRHRQPSRIPFAWGFGPTPEMADIMRAYLRQRGLDWDILAKHAADIDLVGPEYSTEEFPEGMDMWGIRRQRVRYGDGVYDEIVGNPLSGFESIGALDDYPWPDPAKFDYGSFKSEVLKDDPDMLKAKRIKGGNPFEIYCWMTGLQEAMVNLLINQELVVKALEHITDFFDARLRLLLAEGADLVDIIFLADDLGTQQGLLLSREIYREIIQPFHRRLASTAKELAPNCVIMFHSDGAVFDILPDVMDAGIECLEAVQTDAAGMEPERLKEAYGGKLSFHGAISVQSLLPFGTTEDVAKECKRLIGVLGRGGGYIAAPSHAVQVGTPPENVMAMLKAVLGDEDYGKAVDASRV